jgi:hypothetical protein
VARVALAGLIWVVAIGAQGKSAVPPGSLVVEDWSEQPAGPVGIPVGWQGQSWGRRPRYDFRIEETPGAGGSGKSLHLVSDGDNSTISKQVGKVDVKRHSILEWRWRVVTLPAGGDSRKAATDDQAGQIYVVFPRMPTAVRSRIIGYVWDSIVPAGSIVPSASTRMVTYVVVRSGSADLDKWITERRNVREDFKRIYGEEPGEAAEIVSVGIDSNDTRSRAESYMGEILFRTP